MNLRTIVAIFFSGLLVACSATGARDVGTRTAVVSSRYPGGALFYEVKGSGNSISDTLVVASLKAGIESSGSKSIVRLLSSKNPQKPLVIFGENDALSAATLERALMDGKTQISGSKVLFLGNKEYYPALSKAATMFGVDIEYLSPPEI